MRIFTLVLTNTIIIRREVLLLLLKHQVSTITNISIMTFITNISIITRTLFVTATPVLLHCGLNTHIIITMSTYNMLQYVQCKHSSHADRGVNDVYNCSRVVEDGKLKQKTVETKVFWLSCFSIKLSGYVYNFGINKTAGGC